MLQEERNATIEQSLRTEVHDIGCILDIRWTDVVIWTQNFQGSSCYSLLKVFSEMCSTVDTSTYYSTPDFGSEPSPSSWSPTQQKGFSIESDRLGLDDNPISILYEPPHDQQCVLSLGE